MDLAVGIEIAKDAGNLRASLSGLEEFLISKQQILHVLKDIDRVNPRHRIKEVEMEGNATFRYKDFYLDTNHQKYMIVLENVSPAKCGKILAMFHGSDQMAIALKHSIGVSKNQIGTQIGGGYLRLNTVTQRSKPWTERRWVAFSHSENGCVVCSNNSTDGNPSSVSALPLLEQAPPTHLSNSPASRISVFADSASTTHSPQASLSNSHNPLQLTQAHQQTHPILPIQLTQQSQTTQTTQTEKRKRKQAPSTTTPKRKRQSKQDSQPGKLAEPLQSANQLQQQFDNQHDKQHEHCENYYEHQLECSDEQHDNQHKHEQVKREQYDEQQESKEDTKQQIMQEILREIQRDIKAEREYASMATANAKLEIKSEPLLAASLTRATLRKTQL